jgi:hypothetical protein
MAGHVAVAVSSGVVQGSLAAMVAALMTTGVLLAGDAQRSRYRSHIVAVTGGTDIVAAEDP